MGRAPCCDKANVKRGPWSPEEDAKLKDYISTYGTAGNWIALPHKAGLRRCGKSCRLRWLNYLRPNIKHGDFSHEEDNIICTLFATIGSRWSIIAAQLPGRTDNDIKNYWNTKLKKKLMRMSSNPESLVSHIHNHTFKANKSVILENSASPDESSLLLSSSPPFNSGPNYCNTLPLTGFDQTGILLNSTSQDAAGRGHLCPSPIQNNYLVYAGAPEPSCSSSDGTHNQYQTSASMGYGLDEIKQLISTNNNTTTISTSQNGDSSYSFCFDENYTGEGVMMYYY